MRRNFHLAAANEFKSYAKVDNVQNKQNSLKVDLQLLKYFRGKKVFKRSHCKKLKIFNFLSFSPWKICLDQSQSFLFCSMEIFQQL